MNINERRTFIDWKVTKVWSKGLTKFRPWTSNRCKPPNVLYLGFFVVFHPSEENLLHRIRVYLKYIIFRRQDENRTEIKFFKKLYRLSSGKRVTGEEDWLDSYTSFSIYVMQKWVNRPFVNYSKVKRSAIGEYIRNSSKWGTNSYYTKTSKNFKWRKWWNPRKTEQI